MSMSDTYLHVDVGHDKVAVLVDDALRPVVEVLQHAGVPPVPHVPVLVKPAACTSHNNTRYAMYVNIEIFP